ncbi:hypothetical protein J7J90_04660 [Candidatus Micrarchaeota archaeon]|nr:hypothetical protein [Candidatus Micrarchaeota archaeon]
MAEFKVGYWEGLLKTEEERKIFAKFLESVKSKYGDQSEYREKVAEAVWRTYHDPFSIEKYLKQLNITLSEDEKNKLHLSLAAVWFVNGFPNVKGVMDDLLKSVLSSENKIARLKNKIMLSKNLYRGTTIKLINSLLGLTAQSATSEVLKSEDKELQEILKRTTLPTKLRVREKEDITQLTEPPVPEQPVEKVSVTIPMDKKGNKEEHKASENVEISQHKEIPKVQYPSTTAPQIPEEAAQVINRIGDEIKKEEEEESKIRVHIHPGGIKKEFELPPIPTQLTEQGGLILNPEMKKTFSEWVQDNHPTIPEDMWSNLPTLVKEDKIDIGINENQLVLIWGDKKYYIDNTVKNHAALVLGLWCYLGLKGVDKNKIDLLISYLKGIKLPRNELGYDNVLELFVDVVNKKVNFNFSNKGGASALVISKDGKELIIDLKYDITEIEMGNVPKDLVTQYQWLSCLNDLLIPLLQNPVENVNILTTKEELAISTYLSQLTSKISEIKVNLKKGE